MQFKNGKIISNQSTTTSSTDIIQVDQFYMGSIQVVSTVATGTLDIERSNDNENWINIASPSVTAGTSITDLLQINYKYVRIVFTGGVAGEISINFYGKGN